MKYLGFYTGIDLFRNPIDPFIPFIRRNSFVYYEPTYPGSDNIRIYPLIGNSNWFRYEFTTPDKIDTVGRQLANGYKIYLRTPYAFDGKECVVEEMEIETKGGFDEAIKYPTYLKLRQTYTNQYMSFEDCNQILDVLNRSRHIRFNTKINLSSRSIYDPMPVTLKEELKKSLEQDVMKSSLNSCYGMGGFTTSNTFVSNRILEVSEALKIWENKNKETKTMEKRMTVTDAFLKHINGITITSTYSKLDHGFGKPYYIYYPEMEITESIADTLLTVLLMAKRDFIKKVVFNPEKGTTALSRRWDSETVTVRCRGGEFDYILGYEMARSKMYLGHNDYNWFNKIKNHRKTHIEYTEKKNKKGGKK